MRGIKKVIVLYGFFILIICYKTLLEISYILSISPNYGYMGLLLDVNYSKALVSWIFTFGLSILIINFKKKPSELVIFFLFILMYLPFASIYWLKNESTIYFLFTSLVFLITIIGVKILKNIKFDAPVKNNIIFNIVCVVFTLINLIVIFVFNGIPKLSALNFNNVYNVRESFNYGIGVMQYFITWQVWVLNLFVFLVLLIKKKYFYTIIPFLIQFIIFLYTGHKAYLFLILALPIIYYFIQTKYIYIYSLIGLNILTIFTWLTDFIFNNIWLTALYTQRLIYLPAQISYQYYEFFSQNELVLLSHSVFGSLFDGPVYDDHPIEVIGKVYYEGNWPNTGYLGDAYMNFGLLGMLVFSILFVLLLVVLDSFANQSLYKFKLVSVMSILYVLYFMSGALLTSLLNGGILFFLFLLLINTEKKS